MSDIYGKHEGVSYFWRGSRLTLHGYRRDVYVHGGLCKCMCQCDRPRLSYHADVDAMFN